LANVSGADAGSYSVEVNGICGNAVTNSASLLVNTMVSASPLNSLVLCPGGSATFSSTVTGTAPFGCVWKKNGMVIEGQSGTSLTLTNIAPTDAATYSVEVTGACDSVTNSATLTVNASTTAAPLTSAIKQLGDNVTFVTAGSGADPFSYVWKKNGTFVAGASASSLTLTNLTYADDAVYSVEVSGTCNTAVQAARLAINHPPTVSIASPTNGAVFIAPADFTVLADARDVDGIVTNVEFFAGTASPSELGQTTNEPYFIVQTNLPSGVYTFTAKATDDLGASGTSVPVTVNVILRPPLTNVTAVLYDGQTDWFVQTNRVFNPTYSTFDAVRIYVYNLTNVPAISVHNASGYTTNGIPYVQSHAPVPPGSYVDLRIEYASPRRIPPNPVLVAELVSGSSTGVSASGIPQHINRGLMLADGTFLVEFASLANRVYYVQYSRDLDTWKASVPALTGSGTWIQWIDNGQPKTDGSPASQSNRLYRVLLLP